MNRGVHDALEGGARGRNVPRPSSQDNIAPIEPDTSRMRMPGTYRPIAHAQSAQISVHNNRLHKAMQFAIGDFIDGNYKGMGRWYPGRVIDIGADGTYTLLYEDGDIEEGVAPCNIWELLDYQGQQRVTLYSTTHNVMAASCYSDDYRYPTFTRRRVATTTRELVFATVEHANNACADIAADIAATWPVNAIQP